MNTRSIIVKTLSASTLTGIILGTGIPYIAECRRRDIFPGPRRYFNVIPRLFLYGLFGSTKGEDIAKKLFHSQPDRFFRIYDPETTKLFDESNETIQRADKTIKESEELIKRVDEELNQYKKDKNGI